MKQILFALILISSILALFGFSQNDTLCIDEIKTGKFYIPLPDNDTLFVERTKKRQIETVASTGGQTICKLKWTSPDQYSLKVKKLAKPGCLKKSDMLTVKILSCNDKSYKALINNENCGALECTVYRYK